MYILECIDFNDFGKKVSSGFYGGHSKKYHDIFNITVQEYAKKFKDYDEAVKIADHLNKAGYNSVVQKL